MAHSPSMHELMKLGCQFLLIISSSFMKRWDFVHKHIYISTDMRHFPNRQSLRLIWQQLLARGLQSLDSNLLHQYIQGQGFLYLRANFDGLCGDLGNLLFLHKLIYLLPDYALRGTIYGYKCYYVVVYERIGSCCWPFNSSAANSHGAQLATLTKAETWRSRHVSTWSNVSYPNSCADISTADFNFSVCAFSIARMVAYYHVRDGFAAHYADATCKSI